MKAGKKTAFTVLSILVFSFSSPVPPVLWFFQGNRLEPSSLPLHFQTVHNRINSDIDKDGNIEHILFDQYQVIITRQKQKNSSPGYSESQNSHIFSDQELWQSPEDWRVIQALISDLNHDGNDEIVLLVWREFRSWPIDEYLVHPGRIDDFHDADNQSCHVILIGWRNGKYQEVWAGSALADPLRFITTGDINNDGYDDLIALEGSYDDIDDVNGTSLTVWEWNGFGFSLLAKQEGKYRNLSILQDQQDSFYLLAYP